MKARQLSEIQCGSGIFSAGSQRADTASRQACTANRSASCAEFSGAGGKAVEDRRRVLRPAEHPDEIGCSQSRPVVTVGQVAVGHLTQGRLCLFAAAKQYQVHRPYLGRSGGAGKCRGGGEAVGQIQIQQRHGMPGRFEVERPVGIEIRLQT